METPPADRETTILAEDTPLEAKEKAFLATDKAPAER
jgi:hypothetical protein